MYWLWIGFVLGVVVISAYTWHVWHTVRSSIALSKPLITAATAYEQHPANSTLRILVAGDSTGVGVGATSSKTSIAGRMGNYFPSANIQNISRSGDKLADLEKKLNTHRENGYDLLVLQIGANDITGRTSYEEIRSTLGRVLTQADTISTKVVVMTAGNVGLSPAFRWPLSSYITYRTREVRKIFIEEVAKHPNTSYVDLFKERNEEIFNTDIPRYYAPDLFHPSGDGYGVWFEKLKEKL